VFLRLPRLVADDHRAYAAFISEMVDDLRPGDAAERELVERIVGLAWRRRRLWLAEGSLLEREFERSRTIEFKPDPTLSAEDNRALALEFDQRAGGEALARPFREHHDPALLRLAEHERRLSGSLDAALRMLWKAHRQRAADQFSSDVAGGAS
jgi:hypothetical protein